LSYNREQYFGDINYPVQNIYLTELEYEKDIDRMKELYPKSVRHVVELVEDACNKLAYEGSMMYDEYPDRLMLELAAQRIYRQMQAESEEDGEPVENGVMMDLIGVILNNEMYKRRCRHRRYMRWF
jgi:hypothetical protein